MARPAQPRDPYTVLGVARDAGEAEVKKAFRKLARELHPDTNPDGPDAEEKFKEAAEAYEILSDADRRATYDPLRLRRPALRRLPAQLRPVRLTERPLRGVLRGRRGCSGIFAGGGQARALHLAATSACWSSKSSWLKLHGWRFLRGHLRRRRALRELPRQRRRAWHSNRDLQPLRRLRPAPGRHAHSLRPGRSYRRLRRLRGRRQGRQAAVRGLQRPRPAPRQRHDQRRYPRRDRRRPARTPERARPQR